MADSIYAPNGAASQAQSQSRSMHAPPSADLLGAAEEEHNVRPNPHLDKPTLYLLNVDVNKTDAEIAGSFDLKPCLPVRVKINRDVEAGQSTSGSIEFKSFEAAERAYATVRSLRLCITPDGNDPKAASKPRLLKQLPPNTTDVSLYEMFRPFGPLFRAHCIVTSPSGQHTGFRGMALLEYYSEQDAQTAQDEMHCAEVDGKSISVAIDNVARRPSRGHEFSPSAQPFVPGGSGFTFNASAPSFAPPHRTPAGASASIHAKGPSSGRQQSGPVVPVPGSNLQYSPSAATYIDPCNLFCKNLDPSLSSKDLYDIFKEFGTIVSARVMHDDNQVSREFGFVSFQQADEANRAMAAMHNKTIGRKQMIVRLHEPKRMREQKLAHKFGTRPSGSESPTTAGGENSGQASPNGSANGAESKKTERRQSNSYFKAAMATEIGVVDAQELGAMTRVVRNEVLAGEFSKRLHTLPSVKEDEVDGLVSELVKLQLNLAVTALNDNTELLGRIVSIREHGSADPSASSAATGPSPGGLVVPSGSAGDASSIMSSAPASSKERERLLKAVMGLLPAGSPVEDVTDMLVSLPKKDRALCLFNPDFLRTKVEEAKEILEISEQEDAPPAPSAVAGDVSLSSSAAVKGASLTSTSAAPVSGGSSTSYTLATLAQLPSDEIIRLATAPSDSASGGLPLPKADPTVWKETDAFVDGLASLPPQDQKQKLGDQLFKKVRATAGKAHAPKITIKLLDTEDLRSLAHIMNSYPEVLREKVQLKIPAK